MRYAVASFGQNPNVLLRYMFTSVCRKLIKCNREMNIWPAHGHLAGWIIYLQQKKLHCICDQLIKLIKSIQSVSKFVSFECVWKAEERKSGYYNLVSWKTKNISIRCPFWKDDDICEAWDNKPSEPAVTLPLATLDRDVTHLLVKLKWALVVINWPCFTELTISMNGS